MIVLGHEGTASAVPEECAGVAGNLGVLCEGDSGDDHAEEADEESNGADRQPASSLLGEIESIKLDGYPKRKRHQEIMCVEERNKTTRPNDLFLHFLLSAAAKSLCSCATSLSVFSDMASLMLLTSCTTTSVPLMLPSPSSSSPFTASLTSLVTMGSSLAQMVAAAACMVLRVIELFLRMMDPPLMSFWLAMVDGRSR